jgi:peptide/nickel transport system permease protein
MAMLLLVIGAAVFADVLAQHPPNKTSGLPYLRPSRDHLLGTDDLGRDLWAQLVFGARVSLFVGLVAAVAATVIGTIVALLAGWHRGWVDAVLMRIVDLVLSIPFLVLVLVLATYFGRGMSVLIVLIAGVLWARPARLLRGQVLKVREVGHVVAADAMGAGTGRILVRHILRRLVPLLSSQFVRAAAVAVIVQSGVAFLGLGDPGRVSWGSTLYFANNGNAILTDAWLWWIVPPGVALTFLIVGLAFVGFAFEEIADPQLISHGWQKGTRRVLDPTLADRCAADVALETRMLCVAYDSTVAVDHADVRVNRGRVLGLVGESGSGKSTLALAIMGLLPRPGHILGGAIVLGDVDLRRLGRDGLQRVRGRDVSIVPQAAMSLLDPTMTVVRQVAESASLRGDRAGAVERAREALTRVDLPSNRHDAYPHQLSGGQRQRVVIAMAVVNRPKFLIADEPTTGLDVVTQRAILDLIDELRVELGLDVMLISHDLPLVAARAEDLAIMYAGRIVEAGATAAVLRQPEHPYTRLLLEAFPSLDGPLEQLRPVPGDPPDLRNRPAGCAFAPRCTHRTDICTSVDPIDLVVHNRSVACHHAPLGATDGAAIVSTISGPTR